MKTPSGNQRLIQAGGDARRGFSLVELMIVIAVAMILTSMLLPALNKLRDNVNTVVCASNQRQVAVATNMFTADHNYVLPSSYYLQPNVTWKPEELMAAYTPESPQRWDGLGVLYQKEYCGASECFYCPSHRGAHPHSKYASQWQRPGSRTIYTNFHFAGDRDWETKEYRYFRDPSTFVLLMDGLRTASDINHRFGMNVAYGDMSVRWRGDLVTVFALLPETEAEISLNAAKRFEDIWIDVKKALMPPK